MRVIPLKPIFQAVGILVDLIIETIESLGREEKPK